MTRHASDPLAAQMTAWRHHLHAIPETAFEEFKTSDYVAGLLAGFGLEVERGIGGTGVVGTLHRGGSRTIGLRAELDALDIEEVRDLPYRSVHPGKMHACGHDGHMAMLLGAARHLSASDIFRGTVRFIFQPAEENEGGGLRMIEDGLFDRLPVDAVYGLHNWPGIDVGRLAVRSGPIMAASDMFEITVTGQGTHAGMPHMGSDAIVAASALVAALQTIPSRRIQPAEPNVVSVTQIHGGNTWNGIPADVVLRGTVRSFDPGVRDGIEAAMTRISAGISQTYGVAVDVEYDRRYPATVNHPEAARSVAKLAACVFGPGNVVEDALPSMGAEDFSYMLQKRPGCFVWLGAGPASDGHVLHNERYDFNDGLLPLGARFWTRLVETELPRGRP
ncbi:M20 aminoacylase family protein [Microvirga pudoricolor]|uniref:M20 aminoacylase family protein n=1 Tax=Microvirga pudoricolor TaxID=2778729 RepID=UPI00194F20C6|nr:M20 aminoacylase family protein [Microvirga pudoricolor]MBM6594025.1 amidohydrolase [Microvirga pudoricolor]